MSKIKSNEKSRFSQDVESDGRRVENARDPPGQMSIYIPPGDKNKETYRLSTFHHFSGNIPVDPRLLAANGFYYIGYRDRVKCFSCDQAADNWLPGDDVTSSEWHTSNCDFMNGRDTTNIPISLFCHHQSNERNGKASRSSKVNFNGSALANRFSITSGSLQKVTNVSTRPSLRASATDIKIPVKNDIVRKQKSVKNQLGNTPQTASYTAASSHFECDSSENHLNRQQQSQQTSSHLLLGIDRHPSIPHMFVPTYDACSSKACPHTHACSNDAHLQTFWGDSPKCIACSLRATSQQIINAGMYYLGYRDRVKCWYCNEGLQHWVNKHHPCTKTAKWFPLCESVLQKNNPDVIHRNVPQHPGLEIPSLCNLVNADLAQFNAQQMQINVNSAANEQAPSTVPFFVDSREKIRNRNENIEIEMRTSNIVPKAREMGFDDDKIKNAIKKYYRGNSQTFATVEKLIEALVNLECEATAENREQPSTLQTW